MLSFRHFAHTSFIFNSPIFLCVQKSIGIFKVYLAAIRLVHIENGFSHPTIDESLHLVCRGIRCQHSNSEHTRLPITINLLRTLKDQLRFSQMSLLEQRLLWTAFTLSFYGFLRVSECLSLTCSDVLIHNDYISIILRQSKTDLFWRGQSVYIYATSATPCPVRAMHNYNNMLITKQPHHLVFSAGTISPLSRPQLTTILCHLLSQAGLCPSLYASHSFRIGAATTAAAVGLAPSLIKILGQLNSNLYMAYVRCPQSVITTVPQRLSTVSVLANMYLLEP